MKQFLKIFRILTFITGFATLIVSSLFFVGCTYENKISGGTTDFRKIVSPDGKKAVFIRHLLTYKKATGISAFPDGGIAKVEEDKIFLYISDPDGSNERLITELNIERATDKVNSIYPENVKLSWQTSNKIKYIIVRRYINIIKKNEGVVEIPLELLN